MITKITIETRKKVIENDIETVTKRLTAYEQKKLEDTALLNALTGALQQCDYFLKELDNEKPEKVVFDGGVPIIDNPYGSSDDGNDTTAGVAGV